MPRLGRRQLPRGCFHVLNRGNHRQALFHGPDDYAQFIELLTAAQKRFKVKFWGYCLMSNHWHLVAEVDDTDELSAWMHWICNRHVRLFHRDRRGLGGGHIYQGRFKSFPIGDEVYLHQVLRYVEANPVRARLVEHGRDWPWSSLSRVPIQRELLTVERPRLEPWLRHGEWEAQVDQPIEPPTLNTLRQSVVRGTPFGASPWVSRLVAEQGLETTIRPRGRPKTNCMEA